MDHNRRCSKLARVLCSTERERMQSLIYYEKDRLLGSCLGRLTQPYLHSNSFQFTRIHQLSLSPFNHYPNREESYLDSPRAVGGK